MQWEIGQPIWIRCTAEPGAFSDERLVIIEGKHGPISGFVNEAELRGDGNGDTMIRGVVKAILSDAIGAWLNGSFFTTSGLAEIAPSDAVAG